MKYLLALIGTSALITGSGPAAAQASQGAAPRAVAPVSQASPPSQMPSAQALVIMIRSTLTALAHANQTNNYSVLSELGSRNFRYINQPVKLAQTFESFRTNKIDLTPVVFLTPKLSAQPTIQDGRLRLIGLFPSQPMQVNYDLTFESDQGAWKLFGITVNLTRPAAAPGKPKP